MPTWDDISFNKPEFKGIEIIYSTPFYNPKIDKVSQGINNHFNKIMYARPSDMVFRGYEVTLRFAQMLLLHIGKIFLPISPINNTKVFTDYDIQPVLSKHNYDAGIF